MSIIERDKTREVAVKALRPYGTSIFTEMRGSLWSKNTGKRDQQPAEPVRQGFYT